MDSGTAAITAVESLTTSTGVNTDTLKTVRLYSNKVRDRLVIAGTDKSATPMVEMDEALDAFCYGRASLKMFQREGSQEKVIGEGFKIVFQENSDSYR